MLDELHSIKTLYTAELIAIFWCGYTCYEAASNIYFLKAFQLRINAITAIVAKPPPSSKSLESAYGNTLSISLINSVGFAPLTPS